MDDARSTHGVTALRCRLRPDPSLRAVGQCSDADGRSQLDYIMVMLKINRPKQQPCMNETLIFVACHRQMRVHSVIKLDQKT